jgi:chromosomal replication initiation ATPase DnaA
MTETSNIVRLIHQAGDDESPPDIERIPVKAIIAACERRTLVSYAQMRSHWRSKNVVQARRLTWVAIRTLRPDFSLTRVAGWFDRDPSTVCVGVRRWAGTQADIDEVATTARILARKAREREARAAKAMRA